MASYQERANLDRRAREGETVVPGGTGGKSLTAQEHLAEGRSRGGQTRRDQLGTEGYKELGRMGGLNHSDETLDDGTKLSARDRAELDERAQMGETVVPGGTGGKSLDAQVHLAEGRNRGGQTRKEQLGTAGYRELGRLGGMSS